MRAATRVSTGKRESCTPCVHQPDDCGGSVTDQIQTSRLVSNASLEAHLLGVVDFESALFLQERLIYELSGRDDAQGALLICEHPPLITVGREGSRRHILCSDEELSARMLDVRWINRGGGCVLHVPGQLAIYPILPLQRLQLGLAAYRALLEEAVVDLCREQRIAAHRDSNEPGVFCRTGQVAQVGVGVKSWISYHGLFLNVAPNLAWTRLVQPGSTPQRLCSLQAAARKPVSAHAVRESVIRHLSARLGYGRTHLYTGHHLLRRTRKATVYA